MVARVQRLMEGPGISSFSAQVHSHPFYDAGAGRGEVSPPWLKADVVVNAMHDDLPPSMQDLTVHEFIWQCRHCKESFHGDPLFVVCTYINDLGHWEYWARATTIGWRRRSRFEFDLPDVFLDSFTVGFVQGN